MVTQIPSEEETYEQDKGELLHDLVVSMGGRAAEEIIFGKDNITSGASSDLSYASSIARRMVMQFGMSKKGGLEVVDEKNYQMLSSNKKNLIDSEVKKILDKAYSEAYYFIESNHKQLDTLANV